MVDMKKVEKLGYESGVYLKQYLDHNPIKAFTGGKVKIREYKELVVKMEQLINDAEEEVGIQSSCRKGCYACCSHPIVINQFEVDQIMNHLEQNYDKQTLEVVKNRIRSASDILDRKMGPAPETAYDMKALLATEQESKKQYFDLQLPCPLLGEEGSCMVYPVRPSPCWSYRVYGEPTDCARTHDISHSMVFVGHERVYGEKKMKAVDNGTIPRHKTYQLMGYLPQKLRKVIR